MILVDPRKGSKELLPIIQRIGGKAELASPDLPFGDFCFEGNGPRGTMAIGVERKTLHDMLNCIDDARYAAHQRPGMQSMYQVCYLIVEGMWTVCGRPPYEGMILQGYDDGKLHTTWMLCRPAGRPVMYSKLRRYLYSVGLSKVHVLLSLSPYQTACDLWNLYQYYQKPWDQHTAMMETQILNLPDLRGAPTLVRKWAADLSGIGVKHSMDAERLFKRPITLAQADESQWMQIPGVGPKTARSVVRQIWEGR